ncbi:hypothetical protein MC885_012841, partial [Smutsia gigantea]
MSETRWPRKPVDYTQRMPEHLLAFDQALEMPQGITDPVKAALCILKFRLRGPSCQGAALLMGLEAELENWIQPTSRSCPHLHHPSGSSWPPVLQYRLYLK